MSARVEGARGKRDVHVHGVRVDRAEKGARSLDPRCAKRALVGRVPDDVRDILAVKILGRVDDRIGNAFTREVLGRRAANSTEATDHKVVIERIESPTHASPPHTRRDLARSE